MIGVEMGRRDLIQVGARGPSADDGHDGPGDPERLRSLGWSPRFNLRDAVVDSIDWWRTEESR